MIIYLSRIENLKGTIGLKKEKESLVLKALFKYAEIKNKNIQKESLKFEYNKNGKPKLVNADKENIHFNISHSKELWICGIDEIDLGLDLQYKKNIDYIKLCNRYFDSKEIEYIKNRGVNEFFVLWSMKEAYTKLRGDRLAEHLHTSFVENDVINFSYKDGNCFFKSIDIFEQYSCILAQNQNIEEVKIYSLDEEGYIFE